MVFRSYTHNNNFVFLFNVHARVSWIFQVSVKCCRTIEIKKDAWFRKAILSAEWLYFLLHCLDNGGNQQSQSFSTINSVVNKMCLTIWNYLFGFCSIVLMAICDAWYVFSFFDIGGCGSNSNSGVFSKLAIGKLFFNKEMNLPKPEYIKISHAFGQIPYCLVGGNIFLLQQWLIKPYPSQGIQKDQAIFNYWLSRVHRVIENAFGILAALWWVFMKSIQATRKGRNFSQNYNLLS